MGLKLITPPAIEPVSLPEIKQHLRIDSDLEDALLLDFITAAREYCESYQNRVFITQTWDLFLDDFPDSPFKIPLPPLTGQAEITAITCEADSGGSLSEKYITLDDPTTAYYAWFDVTGEGSVDPALSGKTGIIVSIAVDADAGIVATAVKKAIDAVDDFGAVAASAVVTVTNANKGVATDVTNGNTGWSVAPNVITQGQAPIVHIKYYDTGGAEYIFAAANYVTDVSGYRGRVALGYGKSWPTIVLRSINGVVIRFIAGYGVLATNVPMKVRLAIKILIGHMWENREATDVKELKEVPFAVHSLLGFKRIWPL